MMMKKKTDKWTQKKFREWSKATDKRLIAAPTAFKAAVELLMPVILAYEEAMPLVGWSSQGTVDNIIEKALEKVGLKGTIR